jgi:uncharacterized protein YndB with AHSA1/START domain
MTATGETTLALTVKRAFTASPERVFDAWLDPATAGAWLFATPTGVMTRVEIDARVGGRFRITEQRGEQEGDHVGQYLEIDRPRRLVFTFGDNLAFGATTVAVDIVAMGAGCELTLTHQGVLPRWETDTRRGWTGILEGLARRLGEAT